MGSRKIKDSFYECFKRFSGMAKIKKRKTNLRALKIKKNPYKKNILRNDLEN
jgi:hypothetical protein